MRKRVRDHLRTNVIGYLALFVALGGTSAYAANTVFSSDIVDGEVKTQDLADNAVSQAKLKQGSVSRPQLQNGAVVRNKINGDAVDSGKIKDNAVTGDDIDEGTLSQVPSVVTAIQPSTVSTTSATLVDLGGPTVTVDIGSNGGFVQLLGRAQINTGADSTTRCDVFVTSPSFSNNPGFIITRTDSGNAFVDSSTNTPITRALDAGQHTIRLDYLRQAGTSTCEFRNRMLTALVLDG